MTSIRDRIDTTLKTTPWNVDPTRRPDFCAWLCGLDEGSVPSLLHLSDGDAEHVESRLIRTIDAGLLLNEWQGARHAARNLKTVELLNEEARKWLT